MVIGYQTRVIIGGERLKFVERLASDLSVKTECRKRPESAQSKKELRQSWINLSNSLLYIYGILYNYITYFTDSY